MDAVVAAKRKNKKLAAGPRDFQFPVVVVAADGGGKDSHCIHGQDKTPLSYV